MDITGLIFLIGTALFFAIIGVRYAVKRKLSVEKYVTSRNSLSTWLGATTIFATGMGAWILFSPAEAAITAGIYALLLYAVASALSLWVFIWLGIKIREIMPKGHTLTEFVLHRYGKLMYYFVALITIIYMAIALTAELTGIALASNMVFGIPLWLSSSIIAFGTVAYTSIGGFRTSVFTDTVQTWFILPLIALIFVGSIAFLGQSVFSDAAKISQDSFRFTKNGVEYGITLVIAIVGAEIFNQSWWQRVYSAKNPKTMKRSFLIAGFLVIPVVFIAGLFGFFAIAKGTASMPSVALFSFLLEMPRWILLSAMVLAVTLIMSTIDTLLNGIVGIFTVDIARIKPKINRKKLLRIAQFLTFLISIIAVLVSIKGFSVLYLFLLADIVCTAIAIPVFYGMFSKKYSSKNAVISGIIGLAVGLMLFPNPSFTRGSLLWSFAAAFFIPIIPAFLLRTKKEFDFSVFRKKVNELN